MSPKNNYKDFVDYVINNSYFNNNCNNIYDIKNNLLNGEHFLNERKILGINNLNL